MQDEQLRGACIATFGAIIVASVLLLAGKLLLNVSPFNEHEASAFAQLARDVLTDYRDLAREEAEVTTCTVVTDEHGVTKVAECLAAESKHYQVGCWPPEVHDRRFVRWRQKYYNLCQKYKVEGVSHGAGFGDEPMPVRKGGSSP